MKSLVSLLIFCLGSLSLHAEEVQSQAIFDKMNNTSGIERLMSPGNYPPPGCINGYYDWARGQNGWGYCYQFSCNGIPLNGGQPQPQFYCEQVRPSYFDWGRGVDGWGYCYQFTPYGVAMNEGRPQAEFSCEQRRPSFYRWGRGVDGYTYCYQYTPYGIPMNQGRPVPEYFCRY